MGMKETKGIKRKETNMTADSARTANLKRVASSTAAKSAIAKMTPQDKAMLKILKKKYGNDVYKG
jgi:hypothetical protein